VSIGVTWSMLGGIFRAQKIDQTLTQTLGPPVSGYGHVSPHLWAPQGQKVEKVDFWREKNVTAAKTKKEVRNVFGSKHRALSPLGPGTLVILRLNVRSWFCPSQCDFWALFEKSHFLAGKKCNLSKNWSDDPQIFSSH